MRDGVKVVAVVLFALILGALLGIIGHREWARRHVPSPPVPVVGCKEESANRRMPWEAFRAGDPDFLGRIYPSTVAIRGYGPYVGSRLEAWGSGVVVAPNIIVTAAHVVSSASRLVVSPCEFLDTAGPSHIVDCAGSYTADALDWSDWKDIALLRLRIPDDKMFVPAPIGNVEELQVGDWLWRIGQDTVALASGPLISRTSDELQVLMPTQPGASGGPLFDRFGRLVGIVIGYTDEGLVAVAAPVTTVEEMLRKPTVELPTP